MPECSCSECQSMCEHRPCWPTPQEVKKLIELGFADRLMRDWWCKSSDTIYIICPAVVGHEGRHAPNWPTGRCTFFTGNRLCAIHKWKPVEGRLAMCTGTPRNLHERVAMLWRGRRGKEVVELWDSIVGYTF